MKRILMEIIAEVQRKGCLTDLGRDDSLNNLNRSSGAQVMQGGGLGGAAGAGTGLTNNTVTSGGAVQTVVTAGQQQQGDALGSTSAVR